ncbi:MAG: hypothetical protein R2734_08555 [Nocardioides sp.]
MSSSCRGDAGVRNPTAHGRAHCSTQGAARGTAVGAELSSEATFLTRAHETGEGVVATSSAGRLFDVAAACLASDTGSATGAGRRRARGHRAPLAAYDASGGARAVTPP